MGKSSDQVDIFAKRRFNALLHYFKWIKKHLPCLVIFAIKSSLSNIPLKYPSRNLLHNSPWLWSMYMYFISSIVFFSQVNQLA